jgi:TRAP-type C4-dicarboxylate transport system permease large subunit
MVSSRTVDRVFGVALIVAAVGHLFGSLGKYPVGSSELVWAISASALAILLAAINLLRVNRPDDKTLAWICLAGCIVWIVLALAFNVSIGNIFDPRGLTHAIVTAALAFFSLRTAQRTTRLERVPT